MAQEIAGLNDSTGVMEVLKETNQFLQPYDFNLAAARGRIPNHSQVYIYGYSSSVGSTAQGPLWEGLSPSGGSYVYPSSAVQMTLVSSSTSDTSSLSVTIFGLDSNYNAINEVIALNGTTSVTTVNSYLRINSVVCYNGINVGNITVKNGSTLYAQINAGVGQTEMSVYTVPKGYTFYLYKVKAYANIGFTSSAYLNFQEYNKFNLAASGGAGVGASYFDAQSTFVQSLDIDYQDTPLAHPNGTDIQFQVKASTGTNTIASLYALGYLIPNSI